MFLVLHKMSRFWNILLMLAFFRNSPLSWITSELDISQKFPGYRKMKHTFRRSKLAKESEYEVFRGSWCNMMSNTNNLRDWRFKIEANNSHFQAEKLLPVEISRARDYYFWKVDDSSFHMTILVCKTMQCLLIFK